MANLKNTTINDTGYIQLPTGSNAQRPNSPESGSMRFNTDSSEFELYDGTQWKNVPLTEYTKTYTVTDSTTSTNEGTSLTFATTTENVSDGTTLYYTLSGVDSNDVSTGTSGNFTINNNSGSVTVSLSNDTTTEGSETLTFQVRTDSISGEIVATDTTTINDTSISPLVTSNLILHLDANDTSSYNGSGTVWYDISGNSNNFNIVSSAYKTNESVKYMDFNGSHGCAKNSSDISLSDSTGVTYVVVTRVLNSTSTWRTLTRSYSADHHVIIEAGNYNLGMYDNDGSGFIDSGIDQTSIPGHGTSTWAILYWRWQNSSPYYEFSWNDTPGTIRSSITNSNARYNRGFGSLGAYHNGNSSTPSNASQFWGDIAVFMAYNRRLTDSELQSNYGYLTSQLGI